MMRPSAEHDGLGGAAFLQRAPGLDAFDRQLVARLQIDGRRSFAQLGRELGVSERRIRRRVGELSESGTIKITTVTDPRVLGYDAAALLGITADGSRPLREVIDSITRVPRVTYVAATTGRFPLYVEAYCRDNAELLALSGETLPAVAGISAVETFPYLRVHYQQPQFSTARSIGAEASGVRPTILDAADAAILRELTTDGRRPAQHIADSLGMSESQVRARIKAMVDSGSMQVVAILNPLGSEYPTMAWVGIRAAPQASLERLAETLAELSCVTYLTICVGRFDIFAEVVTDDRSSMLAALDTQIRPIPEVEVAEAALYLHLETRPLLPG
jgi:Lrp/AsnC family transcriptional regulator for asnA, asnC and gidA